MTVLSRAYHDMESYGHWITTKGPSIEIQIPRLAHRIWRRPKCVSCFDRGYMTIPISFHFKCDCFSGEALGKGKMSSKTTTQVSVDSETV